MVDHRWKLLTWELAVPDDAVTAFHAYGDKHWRRDAANGTPVKTDPEEAH